MPHRYNTRSRSRLQPAAERQLEVVENDETTDNFSSEEVPTDPVSQTVPTIRLATLNIQDGRRGGLHAAIRCMQQMNIDIAVLTETKFHNNMFTKNFEGYKVVGTVTSNNCGGIAIIYRTSDRWVLESIRTCGNNVLRATLVSGRHRWTLIGVYIPPSDEECLTLEYLTEAYEHNNSQRPVLVLGDLNVDLNNPLGYNEVGRDRRLQTAELLTMWNMKSMQNNFLPKKRKLGHRWTWRHRREGQQIRSVCDHILCDKFTTIRNCQLKVPRLSTDHNLLLATLRADDKRSHRRYIRRRQAFPIKPPIGSNANEGDKILSMLSKLVVTEKKECRNASWITENTWRLIDRRASCRRNGRSEEARRLSGSIKRSLQRDRVNRAADAAMRAQGFLESNQPREAYGAIRGWYKEAGPRPSCPSKEELEEIRSEYEILHTRQDPIGSDINVHVTPYSIKDDPPSEDEVKSAIQRLKTGKAAGPSGIKAEHLKKWMADAHPEGEEVEPSEEAVEIWNSLLELINLAFTDGTIPKGF